jgi:hypothetical protein
MFEYISKNLIFLILQFFLILKASKKTVIKSILPQNPKVWEKKVLVNEDDNSNDKTKNEDLGTIELPQKEGETEKWFSWNFKYWSNLNKIRDLKTQTHLPWLFESLGHVATKKTQKVLLQSQNPQIKINQHILKL